MDSIYCPRMQTLIKTKSPETAVQLQQMDLEMKRLELDVKVCRTEREGAGGKCFLKGVRG